MDSNAVQISSPVVLRDVNVNVNVSVAQSAGGSAIAQAQHAARIRKRTKTGCLTCRKRRIKCGEERPTCTNCIKSKRHCEGYNQRVVFKNPLGNWPGQHPANPLQYHNAMISGVRASDGRPQDGVADMRPNALISPLHPRADYMYPMDPNGQMLPVTPISAGPYAPSSSPWTGPMSAGPLSIGPFGNGPPSAGPFSAGPFSAGPYGDGQFHIGGFPPGAYPFPQAPPPQMVPGGPEQQAYNFHPDFAPKYGQAHAPPLTPHDQGGFVQNPLTVQDTVSEAQQQQEWLQPKSEPMTSPYRSDSLPETELGLHQEDRKPTMSSERTISVVQHYNQDVHQNPQMGEMNRSQHGIISPASSQNELLFSRYQPPGSVQKTAHPHTSPPTQPPQAPIPQEDPPDVVFSPNQLLDEAAIEQEDDDYYDVESDDDMEVPAGQTMISGAASQRDFGMILALHRELTNDVSMRRYDAFIYAGILDSYRAEWVASPLKNPKTARVFAHFLYVTGPSLSIYERHPRNTSAMFSDSPIPSSQQNLWTYTLPMMALNHQGLLHAMLALASLHIAKLQGASVTPSFKHYAYALKRIHHCVGHPKKRHLATTLAATLLLGFYEVMTADHTKWSSHLLGAKQLIVEIDYAGMTREIRKMKASKAARDRQAGLESSDIVLQSDGSYSYQDNGHALDEGLVSTLIGRKLRYDEFGRIIDEPAAKSGFSSIPKDLDIGKYELYQDLFWWYARQDAYQSIVSGNRLLMDYRRWSDCPPRARMGRPDSVYGTHDHVILLLGRIADFVSRDRVRKTKVMELNGGQWRPPPDSPFFGGSQGRGPPGGPPPGQGRPGGPPPGMQMPPHGQSDRRGLMAQPQDQQQTPPRPPNIPFYGMAPAAPAASMPSSYSAHKPDSPTSSSPGSTTSSPSYDLAAATAAAVDEWGQIRAALNVFASHFGPGFQPLSAEYHQPLATPFGEALAFRSYDIGVLWGLYYMCQIILIRAHPHMPPAAMMAAGVAAQHTAKYANDIGRIAFGIIPGPSNLPLNPSLGASLCEITMPLFFAGVQYQDFHQRTWLVTHIRDICARTGWASAGMIAAGCERAWERAAQVGRGPPWQRMTDRMPPLNEDERVHRGTGHFAGGEPREISDKRFVHVNAGTRVHWAMGILSEDRDVEAIGEGINRGVADDLGPSG
ncbi:hypothetical protein K402DRAFT_424384 [Aulographum hederae CBS 113979]|uniref:Zn(2)-C6 fungal-type domain-containing protein n=1 Tax=Aulographum hederae CBS 113979 TaxID=1176131 RepID=A0A6G1GPE6_9PEZI|nr:hypothetical protein K402DRAFT_424384 [Aulographum hederae CBS 113979]